MAGSSSLILDNSMFLCTISTVSRAIDLIRECVPNLPHVTHESHKLPRPTISAFLPARTSVADVRAQTTRSTPTAPSALGSYPELPSPEGVPNVQNLSSTTGCHYSSGCHILSHALVCCQTSQGSTRRVWKKIELTRGYFGHRCYSARRFIYLSTIL
ncbi:hypothetical protein EDB19DRAFT_1180168 [Suillus lakei]|nr:hypothetical protein EDB19DRAFT_1180168 [Suillus lakei]